MPLILDREAVLHLVEEIEVIMTAHQLWLKRLHQALLFDDGSASFEDPGARLKSPLHQWHASNAKNPLSGYPDFPAIAKLDIEIHEVAGRLCADKRSFGRMDEEEYDHCMSLSLCLNASLRSLQMDVLGELLATDPLTGCLGRRGMIDKLKGEQERAERVGQPCCICLLDLDHFKRINDERGHAAGDETLRQGMKFVLSHLRKYDSLFRYGGEEFLICLPNTPLADAAAIIERLRAGIESLAIIPAEGTPFYVTASFGLIEMSSGKSVEDWIDAADQALYRAKRGGRNWVEVGGVGHGLAKVSSEAAQAVLANPSIRVLMKVGA